MEIVRLINDVCVINTEGDSIKDTRGNMLCLGCVFDKDDYGCALALSIEHHTTLHGEVIPLCEAREGIWRNYALEHSKKPRRKLTINTETNGSK